MKTIARVLFVEKTRINKPLVPGKEIILWYTKDIAKHHWRNTFMRVLILPDRVENRLESLSKETGLSAEELALCAIEEFLDIQEEKAE